MSTVDNSIGPAPTISACLVPQTPWRNNCISPISHILAKGYNFATGFGINILFYYGDDVLQHGLLARLRVRVSVLV